MRGLEGEQVLMRIFLGEDDRNKGRPTWSVLLELLREEGIAGATVTRGIAGFGAKSLLHTGNLLRLSGDLPMVIEAVEAGKRKENNRLPLSDAETRS